MAKKKGSAPAPTKPRKAVKPSKENARKAKKLVTLLISGRKINETETWFLNDFMDRAIGRLPSEEAYAAEAERRRKK